MRISLTGATLVVGLISLGAAMPVHAQPAAGVRVLDIAAVFENHQGFKARREELRRDQQEFESYMRSARKAAVAEAEAQKSFEAGSPEFKKHQLTLVNMQADMQVKAQLKASEMRERDARIYFEAYREIQEQVSQYSQQRGIVAVLRFDSRAIDPAQPESVVEGLNRPVVYQDGLDITREIIDRVNRGVPPKDLTRKPQIPGGNKR